LHRNGDESAAHAALAEVLRDACTEGFVRLMLDEGPQTGALIRGFMAAQSETVPARRDPLFTEYLQRLLQSFGFSNDQQDAPAATATGLREPLTRQELRVLALLAEGYSNTAIGEKLFVSANTVRTHLRGINAKLGAGNRTQAVAVARKLGMIR
jgi:LuxR family maltose regulon positive regulatory protein